MNQFLYAKRHDNKFNAAAFWLFHPLLVDKVSLRVVLLSRTPSYLLVWQSRQAELQQPDTTGQHRDNVFSYERQKNPQWPQLNIAVIDIIKKKKKKFCILL